MILFFVFVTVNLTICTSYFITEPLIMLETLKLEHFRGLWVDKLPDEILEQHSDICEFLTKSLIIQGFRSYYDPDHPSYMFTENSPIYEMGNQPLNEPFMYQDDRHSLHLLPCHLTKSTYYGNTVLQTIYITKVHNYKSLIMIVNIYPSKLPYELCILGFITESADLQQIQNVKFGRLLDSFSNLIQKKPKEGYNEASRLFVFRHQLTVEEKLQILKLCASVYKMLLPEIRIEQKVAVVVATLLEKDFSPKKAVLRLQVIECEVSENFKFDLIYYAPSALFVSYFDKTTEKKQLALFMTQNNDTVLLLHSVFIHIDNSKIKN